MSSPSQQAQELVTQFFNGNRKHVRLTLGKLSGARAAAVTWYLADALSGEAFDYHRGVMGRLLTDHLPEQAE